MFFYVLSCQVSRCAMCHDIACCALRFHIDHKLRKHRFDSTTFKFLKFYISGIVAYYIISIFWLGSFCFTIIINLVDLVTWCSRESCSVWRFKNLPKNLAFVLSQLERTSLLVSFIRFLHDLTTSADHSSGFDRLHQLFLITPYLLRD